MATETTTVQESTIVRAIQTGLRTLGVLSPALAGRAASWFFFRTPPRLNVRKVEEEVLSSGVAADFPHQGQTLKTWTWGGPGPIVLLVHGWGGRASQMTAFVEPLVAAGHRVVAIDVAGHGEATGTHTSIPEIADALVALGSTLGPVSAVVAHSLGNSAAMLAVERGLAVDRYVGIAGPLEPERWFRDWVGSIVRGPAYEAEKVRMEARLGITLGELHGVHLAKLRTEPMLWVHDQNDREVPFEGGVAVSKAWAGSKLYPTKKLGHRRILSNADVVEGVVVFVGGCAEEHVRQPMNA